MPTMLIFSNNYAIIHESILILIVVFTVSTVNLAKSGLFRFKNKILLYVFASSYKKVSDVLLVFLAMSKFWFVLNVISVHF